MEKDIVLGNVVPAATLVDKEGYCVGTDGALTGDGHWARGVVYEGRAANEASVLVTRGQCSAKVDGSSVNIAQDDPLVANSAGKFRKATIGTDAVRGHALEAVTSDTDALVWLY